MAKRERVHKTHDHTSNSHKELASDEAERMANADTRTQERPPVTTAEIDDLLDEIDSVLETNAEEFVKSYRQKGGE